jgi:hypothetical protein
MGAAKVSSRPGARTCIHRFRYLGEKLVKPVLFKGKICGHIDGELVLDSNGKAIGFKNIGELRVPPADPNDKKRK